MSEVSPAVRDAVDRMLAERGPLPDHLIRSIAKRLRNAQQTTGHQARKPA